MIDINSASAPIVKAPNDSPRSQFRSTWRIQLSAIRLQLSDFSYQTRLQLSAVSSQFGDADVSSGVFRRKAEATSVRRSPGADCGPTQNERSGRFRRRP